MTLVYVAADFLFHDRKCEHTYPCSCIIPNSQPAVPSTFSFFDIKIDFQFSTV